MTTIKISKLPVDVQVDFKNMMFECVQDEATSRMRYFKQNGFKDSYAYRTHLIKTIKPTTETARELIIDVMVKRYKVNGYKLEPWMSGIPNAQYICSTGFTPSHC